MKKNKTILCLIVLLLAGTVISCKFFGKTDTAENSNLGKIENSNDNSYNTNANTASVEPYPAANCPTDNFRVFELTEGKYNKYEGCRLTFYGKLLSLENTTVSIVDDSERTDLARDDYDLKARALSCSGDFSDTTNYQIGQKLEELKRTKQFGKLPSVTYKATVKTVGGYTSLTDCYMADFQK